MDMQLKQLEMLERELEYSLGELQKELPEKKKLCRSLGMLLGIFMAVLAAMITVEGNSWRSVLFLKLQL